MIKTYLSSVSKSTSLTAQIREAERQILVRQQVVGVRTSTLTKKIHEEITAPSTLLLAGGIGFITGELTKCRTSNNHAVDNKHHKTETSPLKTALNLLVSAHTLYTALPVAWIIKSFHQPGASGQAPGRQSQQVPATSSADASHRRSRQ